MQDLFEGSAAYELSQTDTEDYENQTHGPSLGTRKPLGAGHFR